MSKNAGWRKLLLLVMLYRKLGKYLDTELFSVGEFFSYRTIPVILKGCLLEPSVSWFSFSWWGHLVAWRWTVPGHFSWLLFPGLSALQQLCGHLWVPQQLCSWHHHDCAWLPSKHTMVTSLRGRHSHQHCPQHPCVNQCPAHHGWHHCSISTRTEKFIWISQQFCAGDNPF